MQDAIPREALLRLALLRREDGNPRLLQEAIRTFRSLSAAVARARFADGPLREVLAALCVDDATLRRQLAAELAVLGRPGHALLLPGDADWPPLLDEAGVHPPLLSCRGDRSLLSRPQVAIVGSRHASPAGLALARAFAADLAAAGFTITSGLALGIDAMAHEGALAAGGATVAVLGCGIDVAYPRRHRALADRIAAAGCVVSEYLPGAPPLPGRFPARNRIISGLSLGVLVVEAAPDSGSLITARLAAGQGREVFAIPGSIHSPLARGCHQLIREGATLVETSADIVDALAHFVSPEHRRPPAARAATADGAEPLSADERLVLDALPGAGCTLDGLAERCGLPASRLAVALAGLALQGRVRDAPGGLWQPLQAI